jgi:uncharacterized membrane protein YfcA
MNFISELIVKLLDSLKVKNPNVYFYTMAFIIALNGAAVWIQEARPDLVSPSLAGVIGILSLIVAAATGTRTTQKMKLIEKKENLENKENK